MNIFEEELVFHSKVQAVLAAYHRLIWATGTTDVTAHEDIAFLDSLTLKSGWPSEAEIEKLSGIHTAIADDVRGTDESDPTYYFLANLCQAVVELLDCTI